jgi:hypothetical protein
MMPASKNGKDTTTAVLYVEVSFQHPNNKMILFRSSKSLKFDSPFHSSLN